MSNTKNTAKRSVSKSKIIITKDLMFSLIDVQFDKSEIGIIIVVKSTK